MSLATITTAPLLPHQHDPQPSAQTPPLADYVDRRRITEADADFQRLHARTVRALTASIRQFVRALRSGEQPGQAQSAFIHRHTDLMRAAYQQAHDEGQRDYWQQVSLTPHKQPLVDYDEHRLRKLLSFYAPSIVKMAQEAVSSYQTPPKAQIALSAPYEGTSLLTTLLTEADVQQWQDSLAPRVTLQADLTWAALNDGYVAGGANDGAAPYTQLWWELGPVKTMHCADCPAIAAFSPYSRPGSGDGRELYQTPGDGRTACGAGCNCTLSYGFSLEAYERLLDWRDSVFPREIAGDGAKFIRQTDVPQFAAGNAPEVPDVGYHYGTAEHIDRLMREGVDVTRNFRGMYGQGFYMYDRLQPQAQALYGENVARIAIRMQNPLVINIRSSEGRATFDRMSQESAQRIDWTKTEASVKELRAQAVEAANQGDLETASQLTQQASDLETEQARKAAAALSSNILEQGYDGIIIRNTVDADVRDQFVAIKPGSIRVINDEAAAREVRQPLRPLPPPEQPDALTNDQRGALDAYRNAQQLWGEVTKGAPLPPLPDLFTLADQYRNEESLATVLQHWTLDAAQRDVLERAYDALLAWNDATDAEALARNPDYLAQQVQAEMDRYAAQQARPAIAPATLTYDNDAARLRMTHVFPTDPTDEQVANLAGAPPGSSVEVDRTRQITVTHADGTITSTVVIPSAQGPELLNWRYVGPDGTNAIAVDPQVLARQVKQANALGVESIHMKARDLNAERPSLDYWQLPQMGYDTTIENALVESLSKVLPPGMEDVVMLSDLLATPEGRAWWIVNGRNPGLDFDPRPGSYSWRTLDALLKSLGLEGLDTTP